MVTDKDLEQIQKLFRKLGIELTKQEALDNGADLCLTKSDYSGIELVDTVNKFLLSWQANPQQ